MWAVIRHLSRLYGKPEEGRHRMTFLAQGRVYKVPKGKDGEMANVLECRNYKNRRPNDYPMAACWFETIEGQEVLVMERVHPVVHTYNLPEWVHSVDCGQVGYNKNNELVAYDYAGI